MELITSPKIALYIDIANRGEIADITRVDITTNQDQNRTYEEIERKFTANETSTTFALYTTDDSSLPITLLKGNKIYDFAFNKLWYTRAVGTEAMRDVYVAYLAEGVDAKGVKATKFAESTLKVTKVSPSDSELTLEIVYGEPQNGYITMSGGVPIFTPSDDADNHPKLVTFTVTENMVAAADAVIKVYNHTVTTDGTGKATLALHEGDYEYRATTDTGVAYGGFTVTNTGVAVNVEVE